MVSYPLLFGYGQYCNTILREDHKVAYISDRIESKRATCTSVIGLITLLSTYPALYSLKNLGD